MLLLIVFAFLSGLVTILAPCIWPLLPIVLSSTIAGNGRLRPLGVTLGIMTSFTIFTLAISTLVSVFHLDPNTLRIFAVIVILLLGITMIVPKLSQLFEVAVGRFANFFGTGGKTGSGFLGGYLTGLTLGIVWTPCAGPILAAIATLAATGQVSFAVVAVTLAYVSGVGVPLFLFAYGGKRVVTKSRFLNKYTGLIQRIFGVIMIATAALIYTNYDKILQVQLLEKFPLLGTAVNSFETSDVVNNQLSNLSGGTTRKPVSNRELFNENSPAPEFVGISNWLNTQSPLTLASLKGKVVLVDFWTYTCVNCIRTLPHVTAWYEKYKDKGLVVIGVHTPEFAFEKETFNVEKAIKQFSINYPVAQDNSYSTWKAFRNQYWPAEYLIDAKGIIRRTHFGEGKYEEMEMAIQQLLTESGSQIKEDITDMPSYTPTTAVSPETYLGATRMLYHFPNSKLSIGDATFMLPNLLPVNSFSFGGTWSISSEYSQAKENATLVYQFKAQDVYLVIRPGSSTGTVKVFLDNKEVSSKETDVIDGVVAIDQDRLYHLIHLDQVGEHTLRLEFAPGIAVFAFTFG
jgi:cytochrome c biogenesis protein CcdA/thiol-disulfide isomerase/thioredoxin